MSTHRMSDTFIPSCTVPILLFFFFNDTATTEIYTLSLHDALPILLTAWSPGGGAIANSLSASLLSQANCSTEVSIRSEEHTSELQSLAYLVCRLLLEKKKQDVTPVDQISRINSSP